MSKSKRQTKNDQEDPGNPGEITTPMYNLASHWKAEENRAPLRIARNLYFQEYAYEQIFLKTGVPPSIFFIRSKQWAKVKSRLDEKYLTGLRARVVSKDATDILKKGACIINLYFDRLIKRGTEQDAKDVKLTSDILANIHRIKQLEEHKPTDISVYEKMSPEEAMAYLREMQRQTAEKHDMSMFAPGDDIPEEELLQEYNNSGNNSGIH